VEPVELDIAGLAGPLRLRTHEPGRDLVSRRILEQGCWEPFETRLWLASQRAGDVVVDVGANLGYFALLSALAPQSASQIHAFEPAADNFSLLQDNLTLNACEGRVRAHRLALGARDESAVLYRNDDNRGDHQVYAGDGDRGEEPIEVVRGEAFLAPCCDRIDLLKIDTQGSEWQVVDGLWGLLEAGGAKLRILVELTPFSLAIAGASGRGLVERLARLGLPMSIVDHVEGRLVACPWEDLARWCDNVAETPGDRGFMNIFVGCPPPL
jgi:FkbM family methyltransferase